MRGKLSVLLALVIAAVATVAIAEELVIGREVAVPRHLQESDLGAMTISQIVNHGATLFSAMWTGQEGGGRPLTKGTGAPLADPESPLVFPRNFNRISAPDANSCAGCHNVPRAGGGGDIVANVFVLGQRFDHVTFDPDDLTPTRGAMDESGFDPTLDHIANSRATTSMFGSGYLEMLARQITADLQAIRDGIAPGQQAPLVSKGISYGTLARRADGSWDTSAVEGLPDPSVATAAAAPPTLLIQPWHQAGAVISLRQFSNNAFNHHHGIQSDERFGPGTDPDGDGFVDEMTSADVTAVTLWQATLPPPGRVIPRNNDLERAIRNGEARFTTAGCAGCHVPRLPLDDWGWYFQEPNPYNPAGNLQGEPIFTVNLNSASLEGPRLKDRDGVTWVSAFTDFKLHDITSGPDDPNREPLNMLAGAGSDPFFAGNGKFLTKRLWGAANEAPYYHHGKYTTMREAILAHAGEAEASRLAFEALSAYDQASIVEFLKTLQVLPENAAGLVVDENGNPRHWRAAWE